MSPGVLLARPEATAGPSCRGEEKRGKNVLACGGTPLLLLNWEGGGGGKRGGFFPPGAAQGLLLCQEGEKKEGVFSRA